MSSFFFFFLKDLHKSSYLPRSILICFVALHKFSEGQTASASFFAFKSLGFFLLSVHTYASRRKKTANRIISANLSGGCRPYLVTDKEPFGSFPLFNAKIPIFHAPVDENNAQITVFDAKYINMLCGTT